MEYADMMKMMEQYDADPKMKMLAQMMANQNNNGQEKAKEPAIHEELTHLFKKQQKLAHHLKEKNKVLLEHIEFLLDRNDKLAWALGACKDCWGDDSGCRTCRGEGTPGFYKVDETFVQNVSRKLNPVSDKVKQ